MLDAGEYEAMQERIELLQDVHASIGQIEDGKGSSTMTRWPPC